MYISSYFTSHLNPSPTTQAVCEAFGLGLREVPRFVLCDNLNVELAPGRILFITGPSGSGKSSLLRLLKCLHRPSVDLDDLRLDPGRPVPDHFELPLPEALHFLNRAGLGEATLLLRTPAELSDGQQFRLRLAMALAKRPTYIVADRFLDSLDRLTAEILAANVRKFATQERVAFLLASPHDGMLDQLRPDVYIEKQFGENPQVRLRD